MRKQHHINEMSVCNPVLNNQLPMAAEMLEGIAHRQHYPGQYNTTCHVLHGGSACN